MSNSLNKTVIILLCIVGGIGVIVASCALGFFVGRGFERRNLLNKPNVLARELGAMAGRPGSMGGGRIQALGSVVQGLKGYGIAGEVTEIKTDENKIVIEDLARGEKWDVTVSADTKYKKNVDEDGSLGEIQVGDKIMVIGDKNVDEKTVTADEVITLKSPEE